MSRHRDLNRKLKQRLDLHARQILLQIAVPLDEPLLVPASDDDHAVIIRVNPVSLAETQVNERFPGSHLGPTELHIWNALAAGPLFGWQIAAKLNWKYEAKLKHLLSALEERGVLVNEERIGYARANL